MKSHLNMGIHNTLCVYLPVIASKSYEKKIFIHDSLFFKSLHVKTFDLSLKGEAPLAAATQSKTSSTPVDDDDAAAADDAGKRHLIWSWSKLEIMLIDDWMRILLTRILTIIETVISKMSLYLFFSLSVCLCMYLFLCQSVSLSFGLRLSVCLSICLWLAGCLSVTFVSLHPCHSVYRMVHLLLVCVLLPEISFKLFQ